MADKLWRSIYDCAVTIYFAQLPHRGALLIDGPDRSKFLQGQTTCDVSAVTAKTAVQGAYCTPQGRLVCDFRILHDTEDSWLLQMDRGICAHAAAAFGKYIVFSKAEITDASDQWTSFAVWTDTPGEWASGWGLNGQWQDGHSRWVQTDAKGQRFECLVPAAHAAELQAALAAEMTQATAEEWQLLEISAGIGHVETATIEEFIPQMLNYQLTGHISFTKGCYTGQEVVARMHYRGKLKRPMYLASLGQTSPPAAGTPLYAAGTEQSIGNIVNAAALGDGCLVLAVITTKALDGGVHLSDPAGPLLALGKLPYSLGDTDSEE